METHAIDVFKPYQVESRQHNNSGTFRPTTSQPIRTHRMAHQGQNDHPALHCEASISTGLFNGSHTRSSGTRLESSEGQGVQITWKQ